MSISRQGPHDETGWPTIQAELSATIHSLVIDPEDPKTVMHALLLERQANHATTVPEIVAATGQPSYMVERTLAILSVEGWAVDFPDNGDSRYLLITPQAFQN